MDIRTPTFSILNDNPTVLASVCLCGCPFSEKTFLSLRATASAHPSIEFVDVSHSSQSGTDKWLTAIGVAENIRIIVDSDRELLARWGLSVSSILTCLEASEHMERV